MVIFCLVQDQEAVIG